MRYTKCPFWNRWKEHEVDHDIISCYPSHEAAWKEGCKALNTKVSYKLTKAIPQGEPYCEEIYELKEE
jgi:hypothetical protein